MKKLIRYGAFAVTGIITVIAFQNCSQPGKLAMKTGIMGDASKADIGTDFVVPAPDTMISLPSDPVEGSGSSSSSSSSSSGGEMTSGSSSSSSGGTMTSGSSSSSSGGSSSSSSSGGEVADDGTGMLCGNQVSDYMFTFDHLTLQCASNDKKLDIALVDGENVFSYNKNSIQIDMKETREVSCGQFFAYFKQSGNALLKSDGSAVSCRASDQAKMPQGFVRFPVGAKFIGGKKYKLTLTFSPQKQDVLVKTDANKNRDECHFKPFFHAEITEL